MSDLARIEELAGALVRNLAAGERRALLRRIARTVQRSQSTRIGRQQDPDGAAFAARRAQRPPEPGGYAVRFLYPKGAASPRLVFIKSWVRQGPLFTGFDTEAGAIRSFFWDKVAEWLPVAPAEQNVGKLRRRGRIRRTAMFRRLRNPRNLKSDASADEAWVGFSGRVAEIARVHQEGLRDRPAAKARPVRYARRVLLGLTDADRANIVDLVLTHVAAGT